MSKTNSLLLSIMKKEYWKVHGIKKKSSTCDQQSSADTIIPVSCMKGAASGESRSKTLSNYSANFWRFKYLFTKKRITINPSVDGHDITKKNTTHYDTRSHSSARSATSKRVNISVLLKLRSKEHIPATVLLNPSPLRGNEGGMEGGKSNGNDANALLLTSAAFVTRAEDGRQERHMQGNHRTTRQRNPPVLIVVAVEATRDKDAAGAAHFFNQEDDVKSLTKNDIHFASQSKSCSGSGIVVASSTFKVEKNMMLGCHDDASFLSHTNKKNLVSIYIFFYEENFFFNTPQNKFKRKGNAWEM